MVTYSILLTALAAIAIYGLSSEKSSTPAK
jgi:hypothetical protein